ncbi:MAG TPA: Fur family transcriptional regulator [Dermatophilaceae bacterium]|nr:Fur family transcriptional regulator [Dermatophilaceae bacterium]
MTRPDVGDGADMGTVRSVPVRRPTRQRAAVAELMASRQGFASAQDVHAQLRADGDRIGLATVYRTLQALWLDGEIDMLRTDAGEAVYRRCDMDRHHHHLVCRTCRLTVEIEGPGVGPWALRVSSEHGFTRVSHQLELFGLCPACSESLHEPGPWVGSL